MAEFFGSIRQAIAAHAADPNAHHTPASLPAGIIMLWSGAIVDIPTGWVLCDGLNSTPDLRNRFIAGAGDAYAVAATGGEATHALSVAELAAHTHACTDGNYNSAFTGTADGGGKYYATNAYNDRSTGSQGSGSAHENRPPYYALAYIMKT